VNVQADRLHPGVHRRQAGETRLAHPSCGVERQMRVQKAAHGQLGGDPAAAGAADPIGDRGGETGGGRRGVGRGGEILLQRAAAERARKTAADIEPAGRRGGGRRLRHRHAQVADRFMGRTGLFCIRPGQTHPRLDNGFAERSDCCLAGAPGVP
jgi:hypothetical protein